MRINHIGYAVKRMDRALGTLDRNVKIVFGEKDGNRIELTSPQDKRFESPIDQCISNIVGTPYHICYQSMNFEAEIEELKKQGLKIIIEPRPAIAFGGKWVVFMMSLGVDLIEIVEKQRRCKWNLNEC